MMKKILMLLLLGGVISCNKNQTKIKENQSGEKYSKDEVSRYDIMEEKEGKDTIKNFWVTDVDTIKSVQIIKSNKGDFELKILNFSLNDSSIVKNVGGDLYRVNFDIYHNRVSEIILKKGNENVISKRVNKDIFKIQDKEFKEYSVINETEFLREKNGELFFVSTLNVPDTDWVEKFKFSILEDSPDKIRLHRDK